MRTLRQIIDSYDGDGGDHGPEAAVNAAWFAGNERMRGIIVRRMIDRRDDRNPVIPRWWMYVPYLRRFAHAEASAWREAMNDTLLGGQGRDDSDEMLDWKFDLPEAVHADP